MHKYKVWVDIRSGYYTEIEANNPQEAIETAIDEADVYECLEWDYDAEVCD